MATLLWCLFVGVGGAKYTHSQLIACTVLQFNWKLWRCCNCEMFLYVSHDSKPTSVLINAALKVSCTLRVCARARKSRLVTCSRFCRLWTTKFLGHATRIFTASRCSIVGEMAKRRWPAVADLRCCAEAVCRRSKRATRCAVTTRVFFFFFCKMIFFLLTC